jgi:hypothetical protein
MPNLTFPVASDRPPVIHLAVAVPEEQTDSLRAYGRPVPLPVIVPALLDTGSSDSLISHDIADQLSLDLTGARDIFGVGGNISVSGSVCVVRLFFAGAPSSLLAYAAPVIAVPNLNHLGARMILDPGPRPAQSVRPHLQRPAQFLHVRVLGNARRPAQPQSLLHLGGFGLGIGPGAGLDPLPTLGFDAGERGGVVAADYSGKEDPQVGQAFQPDGHRMSG